MILDSCSDLADDGGMEIQGHVQNGVVVFDHGLMLPEGAAVTVTLRTSPVIHVSPVRERVQLPLVKSDQPGMLELTNDRIAAFAGLHSWAFCDSRQRRKSWRRTS